MWTLFDVKMLSSSSLGMTKSSGLLCSKTVSTVARHDLSRPESSTDKHDGTVRLIRKTENSFRPHGVRETAWDLEQDMTSQCLYTLIFCLKRKKIELINRTFFTFLFTSYSLHCRESRWRNTDRMSLTTSNDESNKVRASSFLKKNESFSFCFITITRFLSTSFCDLPRFEKTFIMSLDWKEV